MIDFEAGDVFKLESLGAFKSSEVRRGAFLALDCCAATVEKQSVRITASKMIDVIGLIVFPELIRID